MASMHSADIHSADIHTEGKIGVLALQGDAREHLQVLGELGVPAVPVRRPDDLLGIRGLILPGGESTTIGLLLERAGLLEPIRERARKGLLAIYGTCAGLILLAKEIRGSQQPRLGLLDIEVERNAYGRQIDSFEALLTIPPFGDPPLRAVFLRAPIVTRVGEGVRVLAEHADRPVLVQQGALLASTFHPELSGDVRLHRYFVTELVGSVGVKHVP